MKTAKVVQVVAGNPWTGEKGTFYSWWVGLDNGDRISVNTTKNIAPWNEGEEAHYEIRETVPGKNGKGPWHKAKKVRPDGAPGASYSPSSQRGGPRNDRSITIQAMLKSVIESGAQPNEWKARVEMALAIHDEFLAADKPAEAPAPAPKPTPAPVAQNDEDDLPF